MNKRCEYKLCSHGTSWKSYGNNQDAHPYPAFWSDGRSIIFTSDMDGLPCIYNRVDLEQRPYIIQLVSIAM
ncbi:MAG: hypothetical protein HPY74_14470 [Firmicutes bacterium]|nr:hypothetical protein [Bacillota bacterium]